MMTAVATTKRIKEIINDIQEGRLVPQPPFQRRKVWSNKDKVFLIDTILNGYPFPEIYLADGAVDVEIGKSETLLVDGQQRIQAILDYFLSDKQLKLPPDILPYNSLERDQKIAFLDYVVAVRHLGSISSQDMIEVFRRINVTSYSLTPMELNNALYDGPLKDLAEHFCELDFFDTHRVFRPSQIKRMGDVKFVLTVIISMMSGYFNRDERIEEYLELYNDEFPMRDEMEERFNATVDFLESCGFGPESRVWQQSNLLCVLVELDNIMSKRLKPLSPEKVLYRLNRFFSVWDDQKALSESKVASIYDRASVQAANDRLNRARRGHILNAVLLNRKSELEEQARTGDLDSEKFMNSSESAAKKPLQKRKSVKVLRDT
jgi:hypothetical protein